MLIQQNTHSLNEWCTYEIQQIKGLDENLNAIDTKYKMMELALLAKGTGNQYLFDDNLYKEIEEKHLKCFNFNYLNFFLNLSESLENDVLAVERFHKHLKGYEVQNNFEEKIEEIKEKNERSYEDVADLENRFMIIYDELNEIKKIQENLSELDEDISDELYHLLKEVDDKKKKFYQTE